MFVVPDMTQDSRFDRIAIVVGEPHCRFYCGVPLITDEGYALGTLCVLDLEPRRLTFEQTEALRRLSRQVLTLLELRRRLIEHNQTIAQLELAREEVAVQKARADELLDNLLPRAIADELKQYGRVRPKYIRSATVLLADFQGFTLLSDRAVGDAVNTASFMEEHCLPGRINVSDTVAGHAKALFELEPRGPVEAKHERTHEMFFLNRLKEEFSRDQAGCRPNESFAAEYDRLTGRSPVRLIPDVWSP